MVRFLHTADWQIGMTRHFLEPESQARFTAARLDAIRTVGTLAGERNCEFVLVCGDVFESNHLNRQVVARALEAMRAYPVPVYLLPGNHDPLDAGSIYHSPTFTSQRPDQVRVVESSAPIALGDDVQLIGVPWTSKHPLEDLVARALRDLRPVSDTVRILAGHGAVDALSPNRDDPSLIGESAVELALSDNLVQYVALGDRHSFTKIGATDRFNYSGSFEPTDYDEVDPGQVLIVDVDRDECRIESVKVSTWAYVDRQFDMNGAADLDLLESWLNGQQNKERTIARLAFNGSVGVGDNARLDAILDQYGDLFAAIQLWDRRTDLAIVYDDADFSDFGLTGFAASTLEELDAIASGVGEESQVAKDALSLLYRVAGGGE